jgi:hypothetical protein
MRFCEVFSGILMGLLRIYTTKLVEVDERFGDREEEWGVATGRWDGGCSGRLGELRVPDFGYVYGKGAVVAIVGIRGCDGSVCGLELCREKEA